jgi:hypothetical protein
MKVDEMGALAAAFEDWRSKKRHVREPVPAPLLQGACAAARQHGMAAVAQATKVDRRRLEAALRSRSRSAPARRPPAFSRLELAAPTTAASAFAEIETRTGLKVRLFTQTDAALGLLSALLGAGGAP